MDAHAYLTSQGWRGSGHSLHASSDAIGLSRPILVSQKQNVLGVGKKQHRTSDMWWMNAFDKSLKGLDTTKEGTVVQTITSGALDMVAKGGSKWAGKGGLYSCFVKGETLVGSVEEFRLLKEGNKMIVNETEVNVEKKRKREMEPKEERRRRKMEKRTKRAAKAAKKAEKAAKKEAKKGSSSSSSSEERVESKAACKARKEAKRAKKVKKAAKALLKIERAVAGEETKEQRKDRKRLEKLAKEGESSDTTKSDSKKGKRSKKSKD